MRCDAMRCDAMRCGAVRCGAVRCDAMRCDVPVSPISHGLNATEIESDNLQVSYDSVLSECPLVQDIISTSDHTGLVDHFEHLGDEGYAMGEVIYVSFIMTILILSSFIIWEIISKDPYDDQSGDDPLSILRSL